MTERKRAGSRRSLAEATATEKKPTRRSIDDTTFPADPNQIELVPESPAAVPAVVSPMTVAPVPTQAVTKAAAKPSGTKYTAVLDDDTVDAFEQLTRIARRRLGRHVDKIEVLRILLLLTADDASLREQVIANIGDRTT